MLQEIWFERSDCPDGLGDLHVGRVSARAPALSGVFVTLVNGPGGFLPDAQGGVGLSEGDAVAVTVMRVAQGGKGPRLTGKTPPDAPRTGAPRLIARGPTAAVRLARAYPRAVLRTDAMAIVPQLREALGPNRVALVREPAFDDVLEAQIDIAASREVPLAGEGRLLVYPTPALTALDLDAGTAAGRDRDAHRRLNEAALPEVARQIRLRQLAGPLLLDLAGMTPKARALFLPGLRAVVDPLTRVIGVTGLGLIEMVRTRVGPPLHEVLGLPTSPLTHGLAAVRGAMREARARPSAGSRLRASPGVVAALRGQAGALEEYAAAIGRPLAFQVDASVEMGRESIEA